MSAKRQDAVAPTPRRAYRQLLTVDVLWLEDGELDARGSWQPIIMEAMLAHDGVLVGVTEGQVHQLCEHALVEVKAK
jgi:hypothetical protein